MPKVTVHIENAYSDGHQSQRDVVLDLPTDGDLDKWFDEVVYQETGDGHGADNDLRSCYTATIASGEFKGMSAEWVD